MQILPARVALLQSILEAAGKLGALGSLDENMEPDEDEEVDELAEELTGLSV